MPLPVPAEICRHGYLLHGSAAFRKANQEENHRSPNPIGHTTEGYLIIGRIGGL